MRRWRRIVAVTLIDLHLEYRLGVARVDADHRQAKLLELGPQPCGCRSCLKADPYPLPVLSISERSVASGSIDTPSRTTDPTWFTTQIDVCFNDTSSPT